MLRMVKNETKMKRTDECDSSDHNAILENRIQNMARPMLASFYHKLETIEAIFVRRRLTAISIQ